MVLSLENAEQQLEAICQLSTSNDQLMSGLCGFQSPSPNTMAQPFVYMVPKSIRRELYRNCNYHLAFRKYILSTKRNSYSTKQFSDSSRWLLWVSMKCQYLLSMYDFGGKEQLRLQTYSFLQRRNSLFTTGWVSNGLPHNLKPRNSSAFLNRPFFSFFWLA